MGTGESVHRQFGPESGAILALASSHIRVGTFKHCAARGQIDMKALFEYNRQRHYSDIKEPMDLLRQVCLRQAELIAQWMSVALSGVLNTDNMTCLVRVSTSGPVLHGRLQPRAGVQLDRSTGPICLSKPARHRAMESDPAGECLITLYPNDERDEREQAKSVLASTKLITNRPIRNGCVKNLTG